MPTPIAVASLILGLNHLMVKIKLRFNDEKHFELAIVITSRLN
jgi:hypothetical protein